MCYFYVVGGVGVDYCVVGGIYIVDGIDVVCV